MTVVMEGDYPEEEWLERTAVHEAGHAVAAAVLRLHVARVTIVASDRSMGITEVRLPTGTLTHDAFRRSVRRQATDGLVVTLSGLAAEQRQWSDIDLEDDEIAGDLERAAHLTRGVGGIPRGEEHPPDPEYLLAALGIAQRLVAGAWPAIEVVGRELLAARTVPGTVVRRIVRDALREQAAALRAEVRAAIRASELDAIRRLVARGAF